MEAFVLQKLEKVQLGLQEEQTVYDALKERYTAAVTEQRRCYSLLKAFQVGNFLFDNGYEIFSVIPEKNCVEIVSVVVLD
ncbi:hypothetical protein REPUB_Repub03eG0114600 [Reevesia pubescens]